jgi:formate hydrogenlyase transcriptional activator
VEEPVAYDAPEKSKVVIGAGNGSRSDTNAVAEEFAKKQREEIIRTLAECKGRVGGADGAAKRLGINRTTLLSRMRKYGIYAKQYAT